MSTPKTARTLGAGIAIANGDLFLTRQGSDTVDTSVTGTQLKNYIDAQTIADASSAAAATAALATADTQPYFRGEIKLDTYPGVTTGVGVSGAERIANFTAIQAAIDEAYADKKRLIAPPATYEIEGAGGLVVPAGYNGFEWKGSKQGTIIVQFASNTPVFTVGMAGGAECAGVTIDGLSVMYGVDQTDNTSASAFKIGKVWKSYFRNITANSNGSYKPYYACHIAGNSFYFSNTMEDCSFRDAQVTSLYVQNFGTGNIFRNLYVTKGGAPTATTISGPVVRFDTGGGAQYENVIEQLNIEWAIGNTPLHFNNCRNMSLISTHVEGCRLNVANAAFIKGTGSQINFTGLTFLNCGVKTADGASTKAYLLFGDYRSQFNVDGMVYWQDNVSYAGCDVPLYLHNQESAASSPVPYRHSSINVRSFHISDSKSSSPTLANFKLSDAMTNAGQHLAKGTELRLSDVSNNGFMSSVKGGFIELADEDKTLYGFISDMLYSVPGTLASTRTITLSNKVGPVGTKGENIPISAGQMISVTRAGTASGSNAVVNNHDGTTLKTLSTTNQQENFYFNGTDWSAV